MTSLSNNSRLGTLPNFIIIGAQKCGTTSLHYYLNLHPQISMSREKELNFFISQRNWPKGVDWYKSNFTRQTKICGEASPNYTCHPAFSGVPERIYHVVPKVKLIYILRDPIDRIISHYIHRVADRLELRTITEALADFNNNPYIRRSKYYMQLEQYLTYFPTSNILILTLEDLRRDCIQTLQQVFRFLNVDETFHSPKFTRIQHSSNTKRQKNRFGLILKTISNSNFAKIFSTDIRQKIGAVAYVPFSQEIEHPTLDESLRLELIDYLSQDINQLKAFVGRNFTEWCL